MMTARQQSRWVTSSIACLSAGWRDNAVALSQKGESGMWVSRIWRKRLPLVALSLLLLALVPGAVSSLPVARAAAGSFTVTPSPVIPGGYIYLTGNRFGSAIPYGTSSLSVTFSPSLGGTLSTCHRSGERSCMATSAAMRCWFPPTRLPEAILPPCITRVACIPTTNCSQNLNSYTFTVSSTSGAAITLSRTSVIPGDPVTVTGTGFSGGTVSVSVSGLGIVPRTPRIPAAASATPSTCR